MANLYSEQVMTRARNVIVDYLPDYKATGRFPTGSVEQSVFADGGCVVVGILHGERRIGATARCRITPFTVAPLPSTVPVLVHLLVPRIDCHRCPVLPVLSISRHRRILCSLLRLPRYRRFVGPLVPALEACGPDADIARDWCFLGHGTAWQLGNGDVRSIAHSRRRSTGKGGDDSGDS